MTTRPTPSDVLTDRGYNAELVLAALDRAGYRLYHEDDVDTGWLVAFSDKSTAFCASPPDAHFNAVPVRVILAEDKS